MQSHDNWIGKRMNSFLCLPPMSARAPSTKKKFELLVRNWKKGKRTRKGLGKREKKFPRIAKQEMPTKTEPNRIEWNRNEQLKNFEFRIFMPCCLVCEWIVCGLYVNSIKYTLQINKLNLEYSKFDKWLPVYRYNSQKQIVSGIIRIRQIWKIVSLAK